MIVIRDRRTFVFVWIADFFILLGAFFVMQDRYQLVKTKIMTQPGALSVSKISTLPKKTLNKEKSFSSQPTEDAYSELLSAHRSKSLIKSRGVRHIRFSYRNSRPKRVEILGSFNDWSPQSMRKGKNHTWTISVSLSPGEYTYNYLVDGKVIRDPNNPRTAPEGRSLLVVKPKKTK